jgi:hypothetical protein
LTSIGRKAIELLPESPKVLFLLRGEVVPSVHAADDLLLSLGRKAVEMLQPLYESLLVLWRKPTERGISFKIAFLLIERLRAVLIQPLSRVMTVLGGRVCGVGRLASRAGLLRWPGNSVLIAPVLSNQAHTPEKQHQASQRTPTSDLYSYLHSSIPGTFAIVRT